MNNAVDFQTDPSKYRHWRIEYDGKVALQRYGSGVCGEYNMERV